MNNLTKTRSFQSITIYSIIILVVFFVIYNDFDSSGRKAFFFSSFLSSDSTENPIDSVNFTNSLTEIKKPINRQIAPHRRKNVFKSATYLINKNVMQYSVVISHTSLDQPLEVESLCVFKEKAAPQLTRCVFANDTAVFKVKPVKDIFQVEDHYGWILSRVVCKLEPNEYPNSTLAQIYVAVLIEQEYPNLKSDKIYFQEPKFYNRSIPKLNSILNCVHTLSIDNNARYHNILNWIQINKAMGVGKIQFCSIDYNSSYNPKLEKKFESFVEVIYHEINLTRICANLNDTDPSCMTTFVRAYNDFYQLHGWYDKVCTNDCFLNYKYVYKYVSNYDIDDLIFPRKYSTFFSQTLNLNTSNCSEVYTEFAQNKDNSVYSVYDYIQRLEQKHGKASYFRFEHYLVLVNYEYLIDQIVKTHEKKDGSLPIDVKYINGKDFQLSYVVHSSKDLAYLNKLKELTDLSKCIKQMYLNESRVQLTYSLKRDLAVLLDNRLGKSIFNTDLVEATNVHTASVIKAQERIVPVEDGYVLHFRDTDLGGIMSKPIQCLTLDAEYLFFIVRNAQNFNHYD
jgi:hypothetical protein